jgi:hypothetical protein
VATNYDFGKRADELADATRRFLIGMNTGGVAVTLAFAGSLVEKDVAPGWVVIPVSLFVLGLVVSAFSLQYAKHKALKRRNAVRYRKPVPKFDAFLQRNATYEAITFVVFLLASAAAVYQVHGISLVKPVTTEQKTEKKNEKVLPNNALQPTSALTRRRV